ncbi:hypothetical protein BH11CYA1_BH11CYA1_35440 [soil metagenome]
MIEIKPNGEIESNKEDKDKVDYMHPEGKPVTSPEQKAEDIKEREKPVSQTALAEADGHHMCSEECLGKH